MKYQITYLVLLAVLAAGPRAWGQLKLNDVLDELADVHDFQISPDGGRVVYNADQDINGTYEIYSVPTTGGTVAKLNDELGVGVSIVDYEISPDGGRVVYLQDTTFFNQNLFSVPTSGGNVNKLSDLSGSVLDPRSIGDYQITPDSGRVVYRADQDTDGVAEIYSVLTTGGTITKLNDDLVTGGDVGVFRISPNSNRVVYLADQETDELKELYSVHTNGGTVTTLTDYNSSVYDDFQISADSSRVVYRRFHIIFEPLFSAIDLYSLPTTGGDVAKLSQSTLPIGTIEVFDFRISPDGNRVVYWADDSTDGTDELYSVPTTGGTVTKLNDALVADGDVSGAYQITPDSGAVVYLADQDANGVDELYSVPITGGTVTKLNDDLDVGGDVFDDFQISPDGSFVVYRADQKTANVDELFSVPTTGGTVTKLNRTLTILSDVDDFQISPDSSFVVYRADQSTPTVDELYAVPIGGGAVRKLNAPLVEGGDVYDDFEFSPDGNVMFYRADQDTDEVIELYAAVLSVDWSSSASGVWDSADNWEQKFTPQKHTDVTIAPATGLVVAGPAAMDTTVFTLNVGATTSGTATLSLQSRTTLNVTEEMTIGSRGLITGDAQLNAIGGIQNSGEIDLGSASMTITGGTIVNSGQIRGSGLIDNPLDNQPSGEVRVAEGKRIVFSGSGNTNSGTIEVIGGEVEFSEGLTNANATGWITGRDATLRFGGSGLINDGALGLSFGTSDIFGDVHNTTSATIMLLGNNTTFHDEVINDNIIVVSAGSSAVFFGGVSGPGNSSGSGSVFIEVGAGSDAVFFGVVSDPGGFPGGGTVFIEGGLQPGASPGAVQFGGDAVFGAGSVLEVELGGTAGGTYDQLLVTGDLVLNGLLNVSILPDFTPSAGQSFNILDWGSLNGTFLDVNLPTLDNLTWDTSQLYETGELSLAAAGLWGDYNGDGVVDAGDYTVWRDAKENGDALLLNRDPSRENGTDPVDEDDYAFWRAHFGLTLDSGAGAGSANGSPSQTAVPEPGTIVLGALAGAGLLLVLRRRAVNLISA